MKKRNNQKPLTIKEYTKNYKFPENKKLSKEDEYIHRTQNIFLSKILKKKKIPINEDINKTIENIFHKEENRIRMMNILKRRNHKVSYTSERLSISKTNTRDKSHDSLSYERNKSFDYHTPIKKYNKINLITKKHMTKAVTPLVNNRNKKNVITNESNRNIINKEKEKEQNKSNLDVHLLRKKKLDKKSEIFFPNGHIKAESTRIKYDYNKNKKKTNKFDKNKKNPDKLHKTEKNSTKLAEKNLTSFRNLKIEYLTKLFYEKEKSEAKNYKIENLSELFYEKEKSKTKNYMIENLSELFYEKAKSETKNYMIENLSELFYEKTKSEIDSSKNHKPEKCEEFLIEGQKENVSNYTGYILIKKNFGKVEEEISLDKNEDKIKEIFLKYLNEISEEENEFITRKELELIKVIKEENDIKNQKLKEQELFLEKIKEQEKIIQEYKNYYIYLKTQFDKLIIVNNKLKEKINFLETKEEEINVLNKYFSEYKAQKIEEIQNLENKLKLYENELNQIKNEQNKIKEFYIEKFDINFGKNLNNYKNEIKNNKIEENLKKEKDEKLSRALNRIRKKKTIENNNEENSKKNNNMVIKKSDKINQIAKMLEQQMTGGKTEDINKNLNNKEVKTNETKEVNFVNLMGEKPLLINKRKPTFRVNFKDES